MDRMIALASPYGVKPNVNMYCDNFHGIIPNLLNSYF